MAIAKSTGQEVGATLHGAAVTGFTGPDVAWERCAERAAMAYRAGDPSVSSRLWAEAFEIADQHFGRGDPRLATSLTNQALVMRRRRQDYQAQQLFERALGVWDDCWRWIYLMTPGHPSTHHEHSDRLEVYDQGARTYFSALAERGRKATATLERYDELPTGGLDEWLEIKPRRPSDLRKLLAAVLLIAPRPTF